MWSSNKKPRVETMDVQSVSSSLVRCKSRSRSSVEWSSLPLTAAFLILDMFLDPIDHVCFSTVCKNWRFLAKDYDQLMQRWRHNTLPMLLIPNKYCQGEGGKKNGLAVYSIPEGKVYNNVQLKVPFRKRCCGSSHGWLATVDKSNRHGSLIVALHNPFTNASPIHLPPLQVMTKDSSGYNYEDDYEYYVTKVILSADPALSPDNYVVVALYNIDLMQLAFIKRGRRQNQNNWTYIGGDDRYSDIIFYKSQLYALIKEWGWVVSFDVNSCNNPSLPPKAKRFIPQEEFRRRDYRAYIVETTQGDLLYMKKYFKGVPFRALRFEVHRLVFNVDKEDKSVVHYAEVKSIGDEAIFVGDNQSLAVLASNFHGCQPNSIYYTDDLIVPIALPHGNNPRNDMGIFNLGHKSIIDGSYHHKSESLTQELSLNYSLKGYVSPGIWVVPPFNGLD